jgi:hypothetical protein
MEKAEEQAKAKAREKEKELDALLHLREREKEKVGLENKPVGAGTEQPTGARTHVRKEEAMSASTAKEITEASTALPRGREAVGVDSRQRASKDVTLAKPLMKTSSLTCC